MKNFWTAAAIAVFALCATTFTSCEPGDGDETGAKGDITDGAWQHVSTTLDYIDGPDADDDEFWDGDYTITFKTDGTLTVTGADQDEFTDYFGLSPLPTYSVSGDKITFDVKSSDAILPVAEMEFDIVKLTDTEFEFTANGTAQSEPSGGGPAVSYNTSFTVKLARKR